MARRKSGDGGAALVELALILPLLALLAFGTVDLVRAYRLDVRLEAAAREGATFSQVKPNDVDCSGTADDTFGRVALEDPDLDTHPGFDIRVLREVTPGNFVEYSTCQSAPDNEAPVVGGGERVRVEVDATFDVLTPLVEVIVGPTIDMTRSAEVEVQG